MDSYRGKRVLATGGHGCIGRNLCDRLLQLGADVTVIDSPVKGKSGPFLGPIAGKVRLVEASLGDSGRLQSALKHIDIVFNLSGGAVYNSDVEPDGRDLPTDMKLQISFLQECARRRPGVRVVYAGTRHVYGQVRKFPVNESHPVAPVNFAGVQNLATEQHHLMLTRLKLLDAVVLRLNDVYGRGLAVHVNRDDVLATFFLKLALGEPIQIYGDGTQLRGPLYVDDAVTALLRAGAEKNLKSRIYNVGGCESLTLAEIARSLCRLSVAPGPVFSPFPPDVPIDMESFVADSTLIRRELGWVAVTPFETGAAATLQFMRTHLADYLPPKSGLFTRRAGSR